MSFYSDNIILEFALGIAIGVAYTSGVTIWGKAVVFAWPAAVIALLLLTTTALPRVVAFGLPAAVIVASAALSERRAAWPALARPKLLGDASYSIYVFHGFVVTGSEKVVVMAGLPNIVGLLVSPVLAVVVGVIVYLRLEAPITRRLQERRRAVAA